MEDIRNDILIVDDTPENLAVLSQMLGNQGYRIRPAISGEFALKSIQKSLPDLILLDIMMPGMNGYEVCQQLKANEATRDIPVLFISALHETIDKVKAFNLGGVDYITKPFHLDEVLARVKTHLTLRNMQKQLQAQNIRLQQEILERKQYATALRRYTQELMLFNEMNAMLQACHAEAETYNVVTGICTRLFPEDAGYLAIMDESQTMLQEVASWGSYTSTSRIFPAQECQALRNGNPNNLADFEETELCPHLKGFSGKCLCMPISTSDQILGIVSIILAQAGAEYQQQAETKWMLVNGVVEHYALSLANLRLREALRIEAIHDPLTGLYNRRHMEASLQREVHRAMRRNTAIGLMMCDIDHFKAVNDAYGHEFGDVVLREISKLFQEYVRGEDIVCRYGGEEFLLILPDTPLEIAQTRALGLLSLIREHVMPSQEAAIHVTISIGVAVFPTHGATIQETVKAADRALYQAKENGRNRLECAEGELPVQAQKEEV